LVLPQAPDKALQMGRAFRNLNTSRSQLKAHFAEQSKLHHKHEKEQQSLQKIFERELTATNKYWKENFKAKKKRFNLTLANGQKFHEYETASLETKHVETFEKIREETSRIDPEEQELSKLLKKQFEEKRELRMAQQQKIHSLELNFLEDQRKVEIGRMEKLQSSEMQFMKERKHPLSRKQLKETCTLQTQQYLERVQQNWKTNMKNLEKEKRKNKEKQLEDLIDFLDRTKETAEKDLIQFQKTETSNQETLFKEEEKKNCTTYTDCKHKFCITNTRLWRNNTNSIRKRNAFNYGTYMKGSH